MPKSSADNLDATVPAISDGGSLMIPEDSPKTLAEALQRSAKKHSGLGLTCINLDSSEYSQSYEDLLEEAQRILAGLRKLGLKPQDKVIFQLERNQDFITAFWGCILGGFVPVPVPMATNYEEVSNTTSKLHHIWQLLEQPPILTDIKSVSKIQSLSKLFQSDQFEAIAIEKVKDCEADERWHVSRSEDVALLMLTSGSTGMSKAVQLTHQNLLSRTIGSIQMNGFTPEDITLNWMPFDHVAGLIYFHIRDVYLGAQQIHAATQLVIEKPLRWLDWIDRFDVTVTFAPNFAYSLVNDCVQEIEEPSWDLSSIRFMLNGAEQIAASTARRFLELLAPFGLSPNSMTPAWGMAEVSSGITYSNNFYLESRTDDDSFVSVGKPIPGVTLRIVNQNMELVSEGDIGLLQVKGLTVTSGYYQNPEADREAFTKDGWFNTGDLAFLKDGCLTITGRQKDVINVNGVNYYSHEIEAAVEELAEIEVSYTAACPILEENGSTDRLAIFFNTAKTIDNGLLQLIKEIRTHVVKSIGINPNYLIPVEKTVIPKTSIGKIQRKQLKQRFEAGEFKEIVARISTALAKLKAQNFVSGNALERDVAEIWQEVLKIPEVGIHDNFFELGGHSLMLAQVHGKLQELFDTTLSVVDLFKYPTIHTLVEYLTQNDPSDSASQQGQARAKLRTAAVKHPDVAIIGMACRFPEAENISQFWHNLCDGVESISFFSKEEVLSEGIHKQRVENPKYVKAAPILEKIEEFDANFFGYSTREAMILDPQQRLLLECSWEALEDAGYDSATYEGAIGMYAGAGMNTYLMHNVFPNRDRFNAEDGPDVMTLNSMGGFQIQIANDKDFLPTRVSYKLNLKGPSLNVQTACSTSLVAIHTAYQSVVSGECDMALAGGVSVTLPQKAGYLYEDGMILSPDGHCRAFDAKAQGTIFGNGAGIVLLKRLDEAIADGDHIYCVIKGSAINNDGAMKVGYSATSQEGQATTVAESIALAGINAETITYFETHGTGTEMGDPIEVAAMTQGFRSTTDRAGFCAIGSVKTNVGHLQIASGVAGFIKTVLALKHQKIPPSLHFEQPNPLIDFANSPFYVNTELRDWKTEGIPRRAGVKSLGIGGTNACLILEEAPIQVPNQSDLSRPLHQLTLSAKTPQALVELVNRYHHHLETHRELELADICYTANTGRVPLNHRLAIIASGQQELSEKLSRYLSGEEVAGLFSGQLSGDHISPKIAFLFTGQGSQYINMGRQLYETQPVFRQTLDQCNQILSSELEHPLLSVLYPETHDESSSLLDQTAYTQPGLFSIEYALAKLWQSWGINPDAVMGHSVGEYVAATVAGVFSLEEGLKLIAARGRLMQQLPNGGEMVSVMASESQVRSLITLYGEKVAIAAINGPESIVISGEAEAIATIISQLESEGIKTKRLQVSHAFHSPLMEPMLADFAVVANQITYHQPQIPIISNVTGLIADETIATANYWVNHVRQPVRFAQSMQTLEKEGYKVFLEIGSKPILLGMGKQCVSEDVGVWLPSLHPPREDWQRILASLGQLYVEGVKVNWSNFDQDYARQKVALPTYPFQRQRYWVETYENSHQKNHSVGSEHETSQIIKLLHEGNTEALAQKFEKAGNLSQSEVELLPKLLKLLVKEHQQELTIADLKDCLYEVQWKIKARFNRGLSQDYLLNPVEVERNVSPILTELMNSADLEDDREIPSQLEQLSLDYVVKAIQEIGWQYKPGDRFSLDATVQRLGIVPSQQRLFKRMLQMLAEVGIVQHNKQDWLVLETLKEVNPASKSQRLLSQYPNAVAELTLLHRCASELSGVLRGAIDPLQLVFPEGDLTTATQLYQESPAFKVMNSLGQKAIASAIEKLPKSRGVRFLEIGAGTGGTTSYILPHLNPSQTEYVFTDIGALFTAKARDKFKDYPFVSYQNLDIEIDPISQGFEEHQYDVIIAANVLHATTSLKQTLSHVQKLLAPGGMLVLLEVTTPQKWIDLIFGLLEGWWKFQDTELRSDYPLLSRTKWKQVLSETGFAQAVTIPEINGLPEVLSQQSVIIAQAKETPVKDTSSQTKTWLIMADRQGIGQKLANQLRSQGDICNLIFAGEKYQEIAPQEFTINPDNSKDYGQLLATVSSNLSNSIEILHLWSLDSSEVEQLTIETLESASKLGCGTVLHLVQALLKTEFNQQPRLWLVTQGAQPVQGINSSMRGLAQSPVWGMGRVISLEYPELWGGMVDLESNSPTDESVTNLIAEIYESDGEDHLAFRDGQRYVARLMGSKNLEPSQSFKFQSDGTYLITGGLGFLGLKLAKWMVEQGARHLVLIGRTGLPQRQDWAHLVHNSEEKKKTEIIQTLERQGATVSIFSADVTDLEQISSVIEQIHTTQNPLKGIVHAAGITNGLAIAKLESQALESILRPKTIGTWILHQITKNLKLDCFICFSSAGAVWGSKGQADYDAANHFLDTFAYYRRSLGLPGLTINWGSLGVGGLVAEERYVQWMKQIGLEELQPEQGFNALGWLLETDAVQTVVAQVEWSKFKPIYQAQKERPLLAEIESQVEREVQEEQFSPQKPDILQQLNSGTETVRHQKLISYIQSEVAKVLGIKDLELLTPEQGWFELGLDSLMTVELRNQLQVSLNCSLPTTLAFEYPNITSLTEYMGTKILGWEFMTTEQSEGSTVEQEKAQILSEVEEISEEDIEASIARELAELKNLIE